MNSKRSFTWAQFLAPALLAAFVFPSVLSAQTASEGTFTLPFETRWGIAILPAGDYSFTLSSLATPQLIRVTGQGGTALVMTSGGVSERKPAEHSALIVVRHEGRARVRALYLEHLGLTFNYVPPKAERYVLAQAPELIQRLPVRASAK